MMKLCLFDQHYLTRRENLYLKACLDIQDYYFGSILRALSFLVEIPLLVLILPGLIRRFFGPV